VLPLLILNVLSASLPEPGPQLVLAMFLTPTLLRWKLVTLELVQVPLLQVLTLLLLLPKKMSMLLVSLKNGKEPALLVLLLSLLESPMLVKSSNCTLSVPTSSRLLLFAILTPPRVAVSALPTLSASSKPVLLAMILPVLLMDLVLALVVKIVWQTDLARLASLTLTVVFWMVVKRVFKLDATLQLVSVLTSFRATPILAKLAAHLLALLPMADLTVN